MLANIRHYAYRWQQAYSSWEWPTRCQQIPGINKSLNASSWLFSNQDPRNDTLIPRNSTCRWLNWRYSWTILFPFSVAVLVSTCTVQTSSCKKVAKFISSFIWCNSYHQRNQWIIIVVILKIIKIELSSGNRLKGWTNGLGGLDERGTFIIYVFFFTTTLYFF